MNYSACASETIQVKRYSDEEAEKELQHLLVGNAFWPGTVIRHFKNKGTDGFYVVEAIGRCNLTNRSAIIYHKLSHPSQVESRIFADFFTDVSAREDNTTGQQMRFMAVDYSDIDISIKEADE